MKETPLNKFIRETNIELKNNPKVDKLIEITEKSRIEEITVMKSMFMQGFMLGNGSCQLKIEVDIEKEFNKFLFKDYEK